MNKKTCCFEMSPRDISIRFGISMISLDNISMHFSSQEIFRNVSLIINPRDRIGLVGRNGAGKTTLLRILAGLQEPTEGQVVKQDTVKVGYLPQQMKYTDRQILWNEVLGAFSEILSMEKELDELQSRLEDPAISVNQPGLFDQYTELMHRYQLLGGNSYEAGIEQTLLGLGFKRSDFNRETAEFSGGWRMRIELARILLSQPQILLLDEPTNHLDIESIEWLEKYLSEYEGAVVLISHDRKFLDTVTNRTIEISLGRLYDYKVSYSKFRTLRAERREQQLAAYRNQQKKIEDTEKFIERFRYKNTKAVQVQSRIKMLEKMDIVEIELEDFRTFNIKFPPAPRSGTVVIETRRMTKHYGDLCVLKDIDLVIERGEKVAFVGKNGEGKTTFSRILVGELEFEGSVKTGHNISTGYFAQNQDEIMDENKTVFSTIDDVAVGDIRTQTRNILGAFLFHGDDVDKKVKVLSGGERSRLALAQLLLKPYNLLILDEPTNHLDMRSKDILKHALLQYDGTLIVVSHDREFLDGLVDKVYEFGGTKVREHLGGIYEFLQRKKLSSLKEVEKGSERASAGKPSKGTGSKLEYQKKRDFEKKKRNAQRKVEKAEENIARLEEELESLDRMMHDPATIQDPSVFTRYEQLKSALFHEMENWEKHQTALERLNERRN
jgi:ATP-binding cassette subfamily F protein 3